MRIQGTAVKVQQGAQARQARFDVRVVGEATLVARALGKQVIHATGAHV